MKENEKYADQLALIASQNIKERDFWLDNLAGTWEKSRFPFDYYRGSSSKYQSTAQQVKFTFSPELLSKVMHLSKGTDVRLNILLAAGMVALLNCYTGTGDIIIGMPIYRQEANLEFINMVLVLRNRLNETDTFKELILQVRQTILDAVEHQNYPMEVLAHRLGISTTGGESPFFDVLLLLENIHDRNYVKDIHPPMTFRFHRSENSVQCVLEYDPELYQESSIHRIIRHFTHLLEQALTGVDSQLSALEMLTEEEKKQIIEDFNGMRTDYPGDKTIPELFVQQVEKNPDAIALIGKVYITYRLLNKKADQLAYLLKAKGVESGVIVGIMAGRSPEMVVGLLAVLKAGGAYMPIDPKYPGGRIDFILEDSGAGILLTDGSANKAGKDIKTIDITQATQFSSSTPRVQAVHPTGLCYIIYTSGTTGKPKGVMVEHRNVTAYLYAFYREFDVKSSDVVLQLASFCFDVFTEEVYPVLLRGGKIVIPDEREAVDIEILVRFIHRYIVTIVDTTPLLLNEFNKLLSPGNSGRGNHPLSSISTFISGGDVLKREYIDNLLEIGKVYNTYGPTETTVCAAYYRCGTNGDGVGPDVAVGKPIANYNVYIFDPVSTRKLQPVGVAGELCVAGPGVTRGYLNRPELTAEKFVFHHSSFIIHHWSHLYKTGDLARWMSDGNLRFLGRVDQQVKVRGYRIETGEIEYRLKKIGNVDDAVVTVREDPEGEKYLCAYIVFQSKDSFSPSEFRDYLVRDLPEYMVPSFFVPLEQLPVTSNGKVDLRALPEPEIKAEAEYVPPRDEIEGQLARVWQDIFGLEKVGIKDDFFDIGGHSLRAIQIANEIHKEFNVEIQFTEIFQKRTVKELAQFIKESAKKRFVSLEAVEKKEFYVLSSAQKRLYILQQMQPGGIAYNMPNIISFQEVPDIEHMQRSLIRLIQRHESLRTSFCTVGDIPVQKIHHPREIDLKVRYYDFTDLKDKTEADLICRPFDLSQAPLMRVELMKLGESQYRLMMDMHHIITDAVSHSIFAGEIFQIYAGEELPSLKFQYKDYAQWQTAQSGIETLKQWEIFWIKEFEDNVPVLNLPTDYPRPAVHTMEGTSMSFEIKREVVRHLKSFAKDKGFTMFMLVLGLFYVLLAKLSGDEDIVVGTPVSGRRHADLDSITGMLVNTLALRHFPLGRKSLYDFLKEVKEKTLTHFENQEYPFEELVEKLIVNRDVARNPLFDVIFALHSLQSGAVEPDTNLSPDHDEGFDVMPISKFDLELNGVEEEDKLFFSFRYCTKLFKRETIRRFIDYFRRILVTLVEEPHKKISEIEIISGEEKRWILDNLNHTAAEYPGDKTICHIFAEQVKKVPDSIAVVYDDTSLSFRKLEEKSDRFATYLSIKRKTGEPGSVVGILVERSLEMIVCLLGILKAGAVYLPLSPRYPVERIRYMLADSSAGVLITQKDLLSKIKDIRFTGDIIDVGDYRESSSAYNDRGSGLPGRFSPHDPAYIIYTSGSTGMPKGVVVEHGSVLRLVKNSIGMDFSESERLLLTGDLVFDISTFEIWTPLLNGFTLFLATERVVLDAEELEACVTKNEITLLHLIPQLCSRMVEQRPGIFSGLKCFFVGGDLVKPKYINELRKNFGKLKIFHMYGPTENTTFSTYFLIETDYENIIPIGKPLRNSAVYIMDRSDYLQPPGIVGEICVGGKGVARGYLNRLALTADKFVENPFIPGEKMYRTGDLGRWLRDGNIEFLGRIDSQVKIRGFRIELEEIENRLINHNKVKDAVVMAYDDKVGDKYLYAFVVPTQGDAFDNKSFVSFSLELKEYLSESQPAYMIPSGFMQIKEIPLTSNGKVDRKALPVPETVHMSEYAAPMDKIEEKLVEIWSEVLGLEKERIGVTADFFELGGHSLKGVVILSKIHKEFNVKLALTQLFQAATIRELAGYIRRTSEDRFASIEPVEKKEYYEVSSVQRRMYILQQLDPHSIAYNSLQSIPLGEADREKVEKCLIKLIQRHESFRTSFVQVHGQTVQQVHDPDEIEFKIEFHNLKHSSQSIESIMKNFLRPFDLSHVPLARAGLIETEGEGCMLLWDMHHITSDFVSKVLMAKDFLSFYQGEGLLPLRLQYKDYSQWQNSEKEKERIKEQETYWLKQFEGEIPHLNMPTDYDRPQIQRFEGRFVRFRIGKEQTILLHKMAREEGVTLFMLFLALFNVTLSKLCGQQDIVVGTPVIGRRHADLEQIIGMFVNTLPLRNYPKGEKTFREFLKDVKERVLEAFENQDYQFEDLVDKIAAHRDISRNPVFDVMLSFTEFDEIEEDIPEEVSETEQMEFEHRLGSSKFDMTLEIFKWGENYSLLVRYSTVLFKEETMEAFIKFFKKVVSIASEDPDGKMSEIEMISESQMDDVLADSFVDLEEE